MDDLIDRQAAVDMIEKYFDGLPIAVHHDMLAMIHRLPSAQTEEDCDTRKHGYFGDDKCNNCRVRYPSHYERRTDEND